MVDASFSMKTIGTARSQRPQPAVEPGVPADLSAAHDEILLHLQPPPQSDLLLYMGVLVSELLTKALTYQFTLTYIIRKTDTNIQISVSVPLVFDSFVISYSK